VSTAPGGRILLIADVHANYRALEAVLDRFGSCDEIWCLGDIVEFGPSPSECIDLVRQACRYVVKGNHDDHFVKCDPQASAWARQTVGTADAGHLRDLPTSVSTEVNGMSCFLVHGSPRDHLIGRLEPASSPMALREAAESRSEDCILCAHTHIAMDTNVGDTRIVNIGTVGQPRDGDYRAQCMVIEDGGIRFERVEYDLDALEHDYRQSPLDESVKKEWMRYTREGVVPAHGLQLGPFSQQCRQEARPSESSPCGR